MGDQSTHDAHRGAPSRIVITITRAATLTATQRVGGQDEGADSRIADDPLRADPVFKLGRRLPSGRVSKSIPHGWTPGPTRLARRIRFRDSR